MNLELKQSTNESLSSDRSSLDHIKSKLESEQIQFCFGCLTDAPEKISAAIRRPKSHFIPRKFDWRDNETIAHIKNPCMLTNADRQINHVC